MLETDTKDSVALTSEQRRVADLERENALLVGKLKDAESALTRLRRAYTEALEQLQLMRRRLFVAKAERTPSHPEQLAFDALFEQVQSLARALDAAESVAEGAAGTGDGPRDGNKDGSGPGDKPRPKPTGRRDLTTTSLPVERVEVPDPELEGRFERISFEESSRLGYQRGGMRTIVIARAVYKVPETPSPTAPSQAQTSVATETAATETVATTTPTAPGAAPRTDATTVTPPYFVTAPVPKELFRRGLLAPSMIAHLLVSKYMMGVPFYRLEQRFKLEGFSLDRGTMCRYAEDAGATLGAIVEATWAHCYRTTFCLSTDATGVSIQPGPLDDRGPRPCRKGHFFVVLADRDHVFFEYQSKHTSAAVCEMFKGFTGYIQADAHAIYDALFEGRAPRGQPADPRQGPAPTEVGCWSHCRRKFWDAAVCKHPLGLDGLRRIDAIFATDRKLAGLAPAQRKVHRDQFVRPLVDAFYTWVRAKHAQPRERGLVATALGYALNQEQPLQRFLEDGRLKLDNNGSERALRSIATGRNSWLFFGSDDHASAAANLFSLIASCKLHGLDPESYLADVIRVMPYWPHARYLELAPMNWTATRARLNATEMARPLGHITVPPEPPKEQSAAG